jgi:AraC-like DNA-binding protein
LLTARGAADVVERISRAIALRSERTVESASARLARRAVRLLESEEVRVDRVAERLGVSPRHLRRAFTENVGIGPKEFSRTVRLHRAVKRAETSNDWGRIAVDAGYYDQAHLIGDFRELVGLTPSAFTDFSRRYGAASAPALAPRPQFHLDGARRDRRQATAP